MSAHCSLTSAPILQPMYRTCVQKCRCIRDSSAVPINHSTILCERLTRSVYSTTEYSPVHGCPYVCMILLLTTGVPSWCFHYTAAIHNGEVCGYNWGIFLTDSCWFSYSAHPDPSVPSLQSMRDQHTELQMQNPAQDRPSGNSL